MKESKLIEVEAAQKPKKLRRPAGPKVRGGDRESRRVAAAILDVLAGARTPGQAAEALSVSLPRYYALETRALEGFVKACEPRPKGRSKTPEKEIAMLRREVERLRREDARKQALLRAAQRAVGLTAPPPKPKKKRRRRASVRALKAAAVLRSEPESATATGEAAS